MKSVCLVVLFALLFLNPTATLAQTDPGQDPYALTPEKLRMFEGYNPEGSANGLFTGERQRDNGLFSTPTTQLGGAAPEAVLTAPERTNVDTATFLVLTSKYSPTVGLTKDSKINVTVRVKNVSQITVDNIVLKATLPKNEINATLLDDPVTPDLKAGSSLIKGLTWDKLLSKDDPPYSIPFSLGPGKSADFRWSIKPTSDDSIIRWTFTATYGAGESILLQWITITNPNPQAGSGGTGPGGSPGSGVNPCAGGAGSGPFPDALSGSGIVQQYKQKFNIVLESSALDFTDPQYHGLLKAWWEVLLTVECTPFLQEAFGGQPLRISSGSGGGYWGEYKGLNLQIMWIDNINAGTVAHIKQNLIHELGHVWRGGQFDTKYAAYEATVCGKGNPNQFVSIYGGTNCSENMSEIVGYFVERDSGEWGIGGAFCATKNPFEWGQSFYYNWAKISVFGGKEYGAPPPSSPTSC